MKRLLFVTGLAVCLFSFSAFAKEKNLPNILQGFYKTFQSAENVNWTEVDDMLRIGFTMNGHQQFAYYFNEELVVVATQIEVKELPEPVKRQLSRYNGFTVSQVYDLNKNDVREYCVVMDSPSKHIVLKGKNKLKVYLQQKK
jgi:hypothetical protein